MSPRRLVELTADERRRAVAGAVVRFLATFLGVVAIYYLLPLSRRAVGPQDLVNLGLAAVLFFAIVFWQVRQILRSDLPFLRAVEGVAVVIPFFLCTYATAYVLLSQADAGSFTEVLNHTGGLYFAVVIFGTVGFGDIAPVTELARLVVSSQVLSDLIFIAVVVRLLFAASKRSLQRVVRSEDSHG